MFVIKLILAILIVVVFIFGNIRFFKFIDKFSDGKYTINFQNDNNCNNFVWYCYLIQMALLILGILFGVFM